MDKNRHRIDWIDYIKGFILFVVCLDHIIPYGTYTKEILVLFNPMKMPCFFFISGILFSIRKYKTFSSYFVSKTKSLLIPYILLSLLFLSMDPFLYSDNLFTNFSVESYRKYVVVNSCIPISVHSRVSFILFQLESIFLFGMSSSIALSMWFVFTLYCVCLIYYVISKNRYIKYLSVLFCLFIDILLIKMDILLPFNFSVTLSAMLFFFLGNEFKSYIKNRLCKYTTKKIRLISIILGVLYFLLAPQLTMVDFKVNNWGDNIYLFVFTSLCGITFIIHFFYLWSKTETLKRIKKTFVIISQNALIILPFHFYVNICCILMLEPLVPHYRLFTLIDVLMTITLTIIAIPLFRGPLHYLIMKERCSIQDVYK